MSTANLSQTTANRPEDGRLPLKARVIAYIFLTLGLSSVSGMLLELYLQKSFSFDIFGLCFLYSGGALLRGHERARDLALVLSGLLILCFGLICLGTLVVMVGRLIGYEIGSVEAQPSLLMAFLFTLPLLVVSCRVPRILSSDAVREFCNSKKRPQPFWRFRTEHLFVAMTVVAYLAWSHSQLGTEELNLPMSDSVISDTDGERPVLWRVLYPRSPLPETHIERLLVVVGDPGEEFLLSWTGDSHVQIGENHYEIDLKKRIHVFRDETLLQSPTRMTYEQAERLIGADGPRPLTLENILNSLDDISGR